MFRNLPLNGIEDRERENISCPLRGLSETSIWRRRRRSSRKLLLSLPTALPERQQQ
mgnify:CR=1 FL=1